MLATSSSNSISVVLTLKFLLRRLFNFLLPISVVLTLKFLLQRLFNVLLLLLKQRALLLSNPPIQSVYCRSFSWTFEAPLWSFRIFKHIRHRRVKMPDGCVVFVPMQSLEPYDWSMPCNHVQLLHLLSLTYVSSCCLSSAKAQHRSVLQLEGISF